jgi:hypothetical protein
MKQDFPSFGTPMPKSRICPQCHKVLRPLLQKDGGGRKYQCTDCEGVDPLHSPDVRKLMQAFLPPE